MDRDLKSDETLDTLGNGRLAFWQPREGYRFSIDSLLLWGFLRPGPNDRWVDLGTGCGILAIALAKVNGVKEVTGLEIQPDLLAFARRNARLNGVASKVTFLEADIRDVSFLESLPPVEGVCANPPYFVAGSGRINPDRQKAVARHELRGTIADFIKGGSLLLKRGGRFAAILPVQRFQEACQIFSDTDLFLSRLRPVHPYTEQPATFILVEALKGKKSPVTALEPSLTMYQSPKEYTPEIEELMALQPLKRF